MSVGFELTSDLAAPPNAVWVWAASAEGINAELWPLVMHIPEHWRDADIWRADPHLFTCWITLGGVIPLDRHRFGLEAISAGEGFSERSDTLMMREWRHERWLTPLPGGGTRLTDEVSFASRIPGLDRLLLPLYERIFLRRHKLLLRMHGGWDTGA
jgi:ligand-binding SRPBCC domain-containing protein